MTLNVVFKAFSIKISKDPDHFHYTFQKQPLKGFHIYVLFQKQPPRGVSMKRYSANMQQNYKRTPMPKFDYSNVALQLYWNHASEWVFCCKVHEYFQKIFSNEHLWMASSDISVNNWNSRNSVIHSGVLLKLVLHKKWDLVVWSPPF